MKRILNIMEARIGVCGIACELCPRMTSGKCPSGSVGCVPKENPFCQVATCAFRKQVRHCFECGDFPCEVTKKGPIAFGYCQFISGKE